MTSLWTGPPTDPHRYRVPLHDGRPVPEPGGGGDGMVFAAFTRHDGGVPGTARSGGHDAGERRVALKLLYRVVPDQVPEIAERLALIASAGSPHLMSPIEVFVGSALTDRKDLPVDAFDVCWLVAAWVPGTRLGDAAAELPATAALRLVAQVARGVAALHRVDPAHPMVHRDIKTSNVRVTESGTAVLVDVDAAGPTTVGGRVATPGWAAPEVANGASPDVGVDAWGIGAIAHHLLVGTPPAHDGAPCSRERIRSAAERHGVPQSGPVAAHVASLLEADPRDRPADLRRWADRLDALTGVGGSSRSRRTTRRVAAAVFLLALAAVATTLMLVGDRTSDRAVDKPISRGGRDAVAVVPQRCSTDVPASASPELRTAVLGLEDGVCAAGDVDAFVDAEVAALRTTEGAPAGVLIRCPDGSTVRLTTTEFASYREIAGRSRPENAVTYGGYPRERSELVGTAGVRIDLSGGGLLAGRRSDTQMFWIPRPARPAWEEEGGADGALGYPTSNVFLVGTSLRLEFERGFMTAGLAAVDAGGGQPNELDESSIEVHHVADPGAELAQLGNLEGRVLRQAGGTSWWIDDARVRHWIPDGGTWECLGAEQRRVDADVSGYAVATLDLGEPATCEQADGG